MAWRVDASQTEVVRILRLAMGDEFIDAVPQQSLLDFVGVVRKHRYRKGEAIFHEDDLPGDIYIVAEGWVKHRQVSRTGTEFTYWISHVGDFFGTFIGVRRAGGTLALTDCALLVIDRSDYLAFISLTGSPNLHLLQRQEGRSRELLGRINDLAFLNVPMRLAKILVEVAEAVDGEEAAYRGVPEHLNQSELAQLVGASRESINQWLKHFEKQRWIEFRGRRIVLLDEDSLRHSLE